MLGVIANHQSHAWCVKCCHAWQFAKGTWYTNLFRAAVYPRMFFELDDDGILKKAFAEVHPEVAD